MQAWEQACWLRALRPSVTHGSATQPKWGRSAAMVERRTWVNMAVRPCLHSFLTHNKHQLFENKVWEIYIRKCIRSSLKSSLTVNDVSACKCIFVNVHVLLYVYIQHSEKSIRNFSDSEYSSNHWRSTCKKVSRQRSSFENFSVTFDSIRRWNINKMLQAYCLHKETVTTIMMLYKEDNCSFTGWWHWFLYYWH